MPIFLRTSILCIAILGAFCAAQAQTNAETVPMPNATTASSELSLAPRILTKGDVKKQLLENLRNDGFLTKSEIDAAALRHADADDALRLESRIQTNTVPSPR